MGIGSLDVLFCVCEGGGGMLFVIHFFFGNVIPWCPFFLFWFFRLTRKGRHKRESDMLGYTV